MFPIIYIENAIASHPRVQEICKKFPLSHVVFCDRYTEVFNRKGQNFRLQKERPSLILAHKHTKWLLPIPAHHALGGAHNFYFSHMLNCPYDCRYCFLQGMFSSAHYVFFINYEDYMQAIEEQLALLPEEEIFFFSGYDCDSLAMESITHFTREFLPFFAGHPKAILELRTKSFHTKTLLDMPVIPNCIIAYTLTPGVISEALEHKAPPLHKRLAAMQALQQAGWTVAIRLDPMIYCTHYEQHYQELLSDIFRSVDPGKIHSVSLGPLRFPKQAFSKISSLYPREPLFAYSLQERDGSVSYTKEVETSLLQLCVTLLSSYLPREKIFCHQLLSEVP